ncbi:MAG: CAP domain-containing protein, partial [Actinomycetota bacterium]
MKLRRVKRSGLAGGERLEARTVFSVSMTAAETMLLQLVNHARHAPEQWATRLSVSLPSDQRGPFAPVTVNEFLLAAARSHSADMQQRNYFSHTGLDGSSPGDRAVRAGYPTTFVGENIYMDAGYASYAAEAVARRMNDGWFTSSGHRGNMLTASWTEFGGGVYVATGGTNSVHGTQLFGRANPGPFLTGVVYQDSNANGEYNVGEGLSGVTVAVGSQTATTSAFGSYELRVTPGTHTISASGGAFGSSRAVSWTVGNANVKVDFVAGQAGAIVNFEAVPGVAPPTAPPAPSG